jgi:hypothetical protein
MVLCRDLVIGDPKCYKTTDVFLRKDVYLGKFVKTEEKVIGYDRDGPPNIQTVYTFEHPFRPSANPLENIPSLRATANVTETACIASNKSGGRVKLRGDIVINEIKDLCVDDNL